MKSSPYFSLALHRTKSKVKILQNLWPSQNIWTLKSDLASSNVLFWGHDSQECLRFARANSKDYSKKFLFVFSWNAGRVVRIMNDCKECATDCGRTMKPFSSKFQTFGLWQINFGAFWGIFGQFISTHFGLWVPCPCFPLFLQKTDSKYLLGFGIWIVIWPAKN